jgi:tetratricopeptide (TPR) repeat protein
VLVTEGSVTEQARAYYNLGHALLSLEDNDPETLGAALQCFEAAAERFSPTAERLEWVRSQNNLGAALARRDGGQGGRDLQQAVDAYRAALGVVDRGAEAYDWALLQCNLGQAHADLSQAVAALEAALDVWTPDTAPREWARAQVALGNVLMELPDGDRAANLKRAIACYEAVGGTA